MVMIVIPSLHGNELVWEEITSLNNNQEKI